MSKYEVRRGSMFVCFVYLFLVVCSSLCFVCWLLLLVSCLSFVVCCLLLLILVAGVVGAVGVVGGVVFCLLFDVVVVDNFPETAWLNNLRRTKLAF